MTDKSISIWKVEEFLIKNLKEIRIGNDEFKIEAECSLIQFLNKFENYINEE